ncbi:hypothetical protein pb186bvf_004557 [Paramecium bursaria]
MISIRLFSIIIILFITLFTQCCMKSFYLYQFQTLGSDQYLEFYQNSI